MPQYAFVNVAKPSETTLLVYHMKDAPSVGSIITDPETGIKWRRVFTLPRMGVDTVNVDPYSPKDFVKATNKAGKIGDLWERSAELSAKRADKDGVDAVKETFYENYAKGRKGKRHPQQVREQSVKDLKAKGVTVDFGEE